MNQKSIKKIDNEARLAAIKICGSKYWELSKELRPKIITEVINTDVCGTSHCLETKEIPTGEIEEIIYTIKNQKNDFNYIKITIRPIEKSVFTYTYFQFNSMLQIEQLKKLVRVIEKELYQDGKERKK